MLSTTGQEEGVYFKDINQRCQDQNKPQTSLLAKGKPTGADLQQTVGSLWAEAGNAPALQRSHFNSENPALGNEKRAIPTAVPAMQWKAEQE